MLSLHLVLTDIMSINAQQSHLDRKACCNLHPGMILERLDGKGPNRHIMKSEFNDVHYMEEFLFCLFNALDIGQKAIGFHHSGEQLST